MRRLNKFEQDICTLIVNQQKIGIGFSDLIKQLIDPWGLHVNSTSKFVYLAPSNAEYWKTYASEFNGIVMKVASVLRLLEILEVNGYIVCIKIIPIINTYINSKKGDSFRSILDERDWMLAMRFNGHEIMPTQDLVNYCNKNFKTEDDIKFNKTQTLSIIAIFVAGLSIIVTILVAIYFDNA